MPIPPLFAGCDIRPASLLLLAAQAQGLSAAVSPPEPGYPEGRLLVSMPPGGCYWPIHDGLCRRWDDVWCSAAQWERIRTAWLAQLAEWQVLCGEEPTAPIVAIFAFSLRKEDNHDTGH